MNTELSPVPIGGLSDTELVELEDLLEGVAETTAQAKAASTRRNYAYWWRRFENWCTDPNARYRARHVPAMVPGPPLHPMAVAFFFKDLQDGPREGDPRGKDDPRFLVDDEHPWVPPSVATVNTIYSALKSKARDEEQPFTPPAKFEDFMRGLRKSVARRSTPVRPLVVSELRQVCAYLYRQAHGSANGARDRVVAGLYHAGLGLSEIAHIPVGALYGTSAPYTLVREKAPRLPITGNLADDLDEWMLWRGRGIGPLLPAVTRTGTINDTPVHRSQIRAILNRLARDASSSWTTSSGALSVQLLADMRSTSQNRPWGTQVLAVRDRALLLVGFGALLRRSELATLLIEEVTLRSSGALIYIRQSKTDQLGEGAEIPIPTGGHPETDVVGALTEWIDLLTRIGDDDGQRPLFRAVDVFGSISTDAKPDEHTKPDTSRQRTDGGLTGQDIADIIKRRVFEAGVVTAETAAEYAGHSLRRGGITSLAEAGVDASAIQKLSRHKTVNVLMGYVDAARALDPERNPMAVAKLL